MNVDEPLAALVRRAQAGDAAAWAALVDEFQDVAAGLAAGWSGDWAIAEDVAQDAFVTALEHLDELADPQAFPAWFKQVVRSAMTRHLRREARAGLLVDWAQAGDADPIERVVADDESRLLHRAIATLAEAERTVIALHYLGGLPYARVATLLGISPAAAKKRAFTARRHLEELLPMAIDAFSSARPSRTSQVRDTVALFLGIRRRDHDVVRGLLARNPDLVSATEAWSQPEAMRWGLQNAEGGIALVRAVQTGDLELVRLVLDAGARPEQRCSCPGAESALWTAVLYDEPDIVELLLGAGADPNAAAFSGATPLVLAAQRGRHDIARRLLAAGADPSATDEGGRTAADWAVLRRHDRNDDGHGDIVVTGIRALDLFAPVPRSGRQWWPAAWELGQFALLTEIVRAVAPNEFWQIGFATGAYDQESGRQWLRQFPVDAMLRLTPDAPNAAQRRRHFEAALDAIDHSCRDKIVMVLTAPAHHHDVTLAVAQLVDDPSVLTTIVIEPATTDASPAGPHPPEGFDAQVVFDPRRAARQLWPAVDPVLTTAAQYPSLRHEQLADRVRALVVGYRMIDPQLELQDPTEYPDRRLAERAQALTRYLVQPFALWEHVTSMPGESTPYAELLDRVEALLD